MVEENLNIHDNIKALIWKAMNRYHYVNEQTKALQVPPHTLLKLKHKYQLPIIRRPNRKKNEQQAI